MGLLEDGVLAVEYPVSTALAGTGGQEGSFRTPLGWHRIHARIGEGAHPGAVFRARVATGEIWEGQPGSGDLILGRVLTLDGLEPGLNRGPGVDSLERTIYIHGTNHEDRLGTPVSHGCVRMACGDVVDLFDRVREGDPVFVAEAPEGRLHFAGVGGSGMSALAQYAVRQGLPVSGSDRGFDQGRNARGRKLLEDAGVAIVPQDGSGVGPDCLAVVCSTAVEDQVPDVVAARRLGVPLLHRSELLAHYVGTRRTLAISGTSGKSTAVAMAFEILRGTGRDPSVITGGDLRVLQDESLWGNAWAGRSDLLVIEADESDGSLVRYRPAVGVVLNLQKDHKEMTEVAEMFRTFKARTREAFCVGEGGGLAEFAPGATVFGPGAAADLRCEDVEATAEGSSFRVGEVRFRLPVPGLHNVENAMAAIAGCAALGVPLPSMAAPLAAFRGVARRFQSLGRARGVEVVDDFGHNPAKVSASLRTARARSRRVLAVFQPHGYGPMRFLRRDFVEAFSRELGPRDTLWLLDIFFAGGTVVRDISSEEVVGDLRAQGADARYAPSREWLVETLVAEAREGDLILVMGARDPSLTDLARGILDRLRSLTA
jgi:UDP-N-acetylmuramate--alanine ligase